MAGSSLKKRQRDEASRLKTGKPSKKRRQREYHSSSEEGEGTFEAVNLLDSDDENILDAQVDDGASSASEGSRDPVDDGNGSTKNLKKKTRDAPAAEAPEQSSEEDSEGSSDYDDEDDGPGRGRKFKSKSKRNDPTAFATSIEKILGTKLSTSRRADPIVARSAEAREASKRVADSALDAKARKQLREQKRSAMERGRVRDVLVATNLPVVHPETGELVDGGETTAQILETERRLRKTATRGVVKMYNAIRAAQVKAAEAEVNARAEGMVGMGRRKEKITEMSRQGFLDLLAAGGGGLKKGGLEEA